MQTFGRTYIREGYPVPAIFGEKIINPNEYADPIVVADTFIGSAYPTKTISLGSTLTLFRDISIDALGEFKLGGHMVNGNGYQNARRGAWPACYDIQRKAEAGDLGDVTALMRARCALNGGPIAADVRRVDRVHRLLPAAQHRGHLPAATRPHPRRQLRVAAPGRPQPVDQHRLLRRRPGTRRLPHQPRPARLLRAAHVPVVPGDAARQLLERGGDEP